jgi:hypothetical protein
MTVVGALIAFLTVPSAPLQGGDDAEGDEAAGRETDISATDRVPCPPGMPGCPPVDVEVPAGTG